MRRHLFAPGVLRHLNLLALAGLGAVGAFAAGRAGAASGDGPRRRTPVVRAVEYAAPAVVSISAVTSRTRNVMITSAGSGVIVHPAGFIVTNSHVIRGGSDVFVELWQDRGRYRAQVVANIPQNDLALLRIQRDTAFPYVSIASSRQVLLGETTIAVGNPRGLGDSITVGVVSALGRDAKLAGGATLRDLIQTDAPINSGNSGGALLNLDGELLGVVVSLMPHCNGIAFAIPGDQVRLLLDRALGGTPASKRLPESKAAASRPPRVASSIREVPDDAPALPAPSRGLPPPAVQAPERAAETSTTPLRAEDFGLTIRDTGSFLQVTRVQPRSAGDLAGLRAGDVLLGVDGRSVENDLDLTLAFSAARPGRVYQVHVRRSGQEHHAAMITPR